MAASRSQPAPTVRRLLEHARGLLDAHGCRHEPLAWSPRGDAISLDQLPGPDPDAIDPDRVHAAIAGQRAASQAAKELGVTLEHLRYIARKHPPETQGRSASTAPPRVRLAALLTAEELRQLVNQGNSLRQIAARYEISRRTIHDELIAHGIPIPPRTRQRHRPERDR